MFFKIGVLKNFANFTGKHLCWSVFLINLEAFSQLFSCKICKIFKNTFFTKHLRWLLLSIFCWLTRIHCEPWINRECFQNFQTSSSSEFRGLMLYARISAQFFSEVCCGCLAFPKARLLLTCSSSEFQGLTYVIC